MASLFQWFLLNVFWSSASEMMPMVYEMNKCKCYQIIHCTKILCCCMGMAHNSHVVAVKKYHVINNSGDKILPVAIILLFLSSGMD